MEGGSGEESRERDKTLTLLCKGLVVSFHLWYRWACIQGGRNILKLMSVTQQWLEYYSITFTSKSS